MVHKPGPTAARQQIFQGSTTGEEKVQILIMNGPITSCQEGRITSATATGRQGSVDSARSERNLSQCEALSHIRSAAKL
ncbi:hypothetical protein AAFF_G00185180 [Aldrovandia affinis]|uniref:Uncharacterized protein n=1 Tax=Aldrovandia affinis TaxID=143900 RepID=A0AAD7RJV8_9TELE|nr:hypothetical protein AAFF_G00185180 [Aldrovandia affinis]